MVRVVIVHRWAGSPSGDWYPWLARELRQLGHEVAVPAMPSPGRPRIPEWMAALGEAAGEANRDLVLVGHSIGCQAILRYLEGLPQGRRIGGVALVAGWLTLLPAAFESEEDREVARPWLETPLDWPRIGHHSPRTVAVFSDNDPYVPLDTARVFKEELGADILVERGVGHFTAEDGYRAFPLLREQVSRLASPPGQRT